MRQEWDYPRSGRWRPETFNRPSSGWERVEQRTIEHDPPKRWTISRWYIRQMRGPEPWPYKAALSALFFSFWLAFSAVILIATLVICMMIWPLGR